MSGLDQSLLGDNRVEITHPQSLTNVLQLLLLPNIIQNYILKLSQELTNEKKRFDIKKKIISCWAKVREDNLFLCMSSKRVLQLEGEAIGKLLLHLLPLNIGKNTFLAAGTWC